MKSMIPKHGKTDVAPQGSSSPVDAWHQHVDEMFEDFFGGLGRMGRWPSLRWDDSEMGDLDPEFEVSETDDEVRVKAELPGVEEDDIEVTLDENVLTIRGEKKAEEAEEKKDYYFSECRYGQFHRTFSLPAEVNRDKVTATFKKGVLTLKMPKTEVSKSTRKRIKISEK